MGAGVSDLSKVQDSPELARFVSKELIAPNDPFWDQLLGFHLKKRLTRAEDKALEEHVSNLFSTFLINNLETGNFGSLIKVFLLKASDLKASTQLDNSRFCDETLSTLLVVRCLCKLGVQLLPEEELVRHLETRPKPEASAAAAVAAAAGQRASAADATSTLEVLLNALIEVLVDVPLQDSTYLIHLEALNTLLVLLGSQMYSTKHAYNLTIYRSLMSGRSAIHACILMKTLLKHVLSRQPAPDSRYTGGGSLVLGLASGLWNVVTLGYGSQSTSAPEDSTPGGLPPLAQQSLHLLLVLTNHCTNDKQTHNPYRAAVFHMSNFQDPAETQLIQAPEAFKMDFGRLYNALCSPPTTDQTTLLLYLLLHKNTAFKNYVLSRTDIDTLVIPTLRVLYNAPESNSHHIYMSLIILLILSEDEVFNKSVHDTMLKSVNWYTERQITEISLGGLLILVVIRTIQYNMTKMRDKYLHTNCLAALANMSCEFRRLHPYVCQRLVSLFELLARKHGRQMELLRTAAASQTPESEDMQDLAVLEEVLRMVLEIINSCLTSQLCQNPNLVYTLLYKRSVFEPYRTHPNFQDITQNIDTILIYFTSRLDKLHKDLGVRDVHAVIQEGAVMFPLERLKKFPELKFKYVEESEPEEFFIPYVWSLVYRGSDLHWSPSSVCLFNPDQTES